VKGYRVGDRVYDTWWFWKRGRVVYSGTTRVRVEWFGGQVQSYDKAHLQFLMKQPVGAAMRHKGRHTRRVHDL